MPRVLKLHLTNDEHRIIEAARHFVPDRIESTAADPDLAGDWWLAEQLTAACQRRIDEVRQAAKGVKPS